MSELDRIINEAYQNLDESKDRFIDRLDIPAEKKEEYKSFFKSHPNLENKINWNKFEPSDIDALMTTNAETGTRAVKNDNMLLLKKNPDFQFLGSTQDWAFFYLKNQKAAQYADSWQCGGEGAPWCIGMTDPEEYKITWEGNYRNSVFVLAIRRKGKFLKKNDLKVMIEKTPEGQYKGWTQENRPDLAIKGSHALASHFDIPENTFINMFNGLEPGEHEFELSPSTLTLDEFLNNDNLIFGDAKRVTLTDVRESFTLNDFSYEFLERCSDGAREVIFDGADIDTLYMDVSYGSVENITVLTYGFENSHIGTLEIQCAEFPEIFDEVLVSVDLHGAQIDNVRCVQCQISDGQVLAKLHKFGVATQIM